MSATASSRAAPQKPRKPRKPKNRFALPVRAPDAVPVPAFDPVPRQYQRHDGWTPERQVAFIGALADTGCVRRAAAMVNMAQTNCYTLRRAPGAEGFRRAWDAALDFGIGRLKDIAFERAIEGELIPVFQAGKLMGYRRKHNNALLMFCLRHYGKDREGKRTTINYFSTRASAGSGDASGNPRVAGSAGGGVSGGAAEASTTTVRTVITGGGEPGGDGGDPAGSGPALLEGFAGVPLDDAARTAIAAALADCAARSRAADAAAEAGGDDALDTLCDDPDEPFVHAAADALPWHGTLIPPVELEEEPLEPFAAERNWRLAGTGAPEGDRAPAGGADVAGG